jgi:hypothetical protein
VLLSALVAGADAGAEGIMSNSSTAPSEGLDVDPAQGGAISHGGGTGLACFADEPTAHSALDERGRLKDTHRPLIRSMVALDHLETLNRGGNPLPNLNESAEAFLQRQINERIRPLSPLFAQAFERALKSVRRELWQAVPALERISDLGQTVELEQTLQDHKNCVPVQIIRRVEAGEGVQTRIERIEYDAELFEKLIVLEHGGLSFVPLLHPTFVAERLSERMGVYQQALFIGHEALYFMARQMGHVNASKVRRLAHVLLDGSLLVTVEQNFDFLYLLKSTGFLPVIIREAGGPESRAQALDRIFERYVNFRREQQRVSAKDCESFKAKWPDSTCESATAGNPIWLRSATRLFTNDELESESDDFHLVLEALGFTAFQKEELAEDILKADSALRFDPSILRPRPSLFGIYLTPERPVKLPNFAARICTAIESSLRSDSLDAEIIKQDPKMATYLWPKIYSRQRALQACRRIAK